MSIVWLILSSITSLTFTVLLIWCIYNYFVLKNKTEEGKQNDFIYKYIVSNFENIVEKINVWNLNLNIKKIISLVVLFILVIIFKSLYVSSVYSATMWNVQKMSNQAQQDALNRQAALLKQQQVKIHTTTKAS